MRAISLGLVVPGLILAPSEVTDAEETLDCASLVHRRVGLADLLEVGLEVEHPAGVDAACEDVFEQFVNVLACWGDSAADADVVPENVSVLELLLNWYFYQHRRTARRIGSPIPPTNLDSARGSVGASS